MLKISLFVSVFVFAMLFVLYNLGGNNDTLKGALEDFGFEATGYKTDIHDFNHMRFYPNISFDLGNIEMRNAVDVAVEIDKLQMAAGFFDVMFRTGAMRVFNLEGLKAWPNTILAPPLYIEQLAIHYDADTQETMMRGRGMVEQQPFTLEVDMQPVGAGRSLKFRFPPNPHFSVTLGQTTISGSVMNTAEDLQIRDIELRHGQKIASGALVLRQGKLSGDLVVEAPEQLIEILRENENLFYPGEEHWAVPNLDLSLNWAGQDASLVWPGECEEQAEVLSSLLTLPGFDCKHTTP